MTEHSDHNERQQTQIADDTSRAVNTHAIVLVHEDGEDVVELTSDPDEAVARWATRAYGTPQMAGEWEDEPLVVAYRLTEHGKRLGVVDD